MFDAKLFHFSEDIIEIKSLILKLLKVKNFNKIFFCWIKIIM